MIHQGDIYLANLSPTKGHEQSGFRPVVVVQKNVLNKHLSTVIVAPVTKNLKAKDRETTFFLPKKISSLSVDSVCLLFQIRTIDKSRLKKKIATLSDHDFLKIKEQLDSLF